jgi:aspartate/methionine/tyrosine aminotransferase
MAKHGPLIHEYGPTTGIPELRKKVAAYYNDTFRQKWDSKYTLDNVCIVPGGRAGLSRVASVIGNILLGYQLPDYAAYEPMYVLPCRKVDPKVLRLTTISPPLPSPLLSRRSLTSPLANTGWELSRVSSQSLRS